MIPPTKQFEILDDAMVAVLRAKTPAERLAIADGIWRSARGMIEAILRKEHPDWSAEAVQRETARRMSHGAVEVAGCLRGSETKSTIEPRGGTIR